VRTYLESLRAARRGPGRWRSAETLQARLDTVTAELEHADPFDRLMLTQERRDLEAELAIVANEHTHDIESAFVDVAKAFSDRRRIDYESWIEVGVPAAILKRAGITR
jgi:hypothetical protein